MTSIAGNTTLLTTLCIWPLAVVQVEVIAEATSALAVNADADAKTTPAVTVISIFFVFFNLSSLSLDDQQTPVKAVKDACALKIHDRS